MTALVTDLNYYHECNFMFINFNLKVVFIMVDDAYRILHPDSYHLEKVSKRGIEDDQNKVEGRIHDTVARSKRWAGYHHHQPREPVVVITTSSGQNISGVAMDATGQGVAAG